MISCLQNFIPLLNSGFFQRIQIGYRSTFANISLHEFPDPIYWIQI